MSDEIRYSAKVDRVIYGHYTDGFSRCDWIELALAALDQAGLRPEQYDSITRLLVASSE